MRKFYEIFSDEKLTPLVTKLNWSHYIQLLSIKDVNEIKYYINAVLNNNLSKRQLQERIIADEYNRLSNDAKNRLIKLEKLQIEDLISNPIIIRNNNM